MDLRAPAAARDVETCEAFLGAPLPPTLRSVWEVHDGFSIHLYGADQPNDIAMYRFEIRGTLAVVDSSRLLRAYFRSMSESGAPGYDDQRARAFADIADFDDADRRTVLDLPRRHSDGEAPIFEANLYEAWPDADTPPLAKSVTEFIERCLRFMIDTDGGGFRYWMEPYYDW